MLIRDGVYYPDINKSKGYEDMRLIYPLLLENFNNMNKGNIDGLIFGFYCENGKENFSSIEDLYEYFSSNPYVTQAFSFWNSNYAILKIELDESINIMPMDFNDAIKLCIGRTNDIERVEALYNSVDDFNKDIQCILYHLQMGIVNPYTNCKSFIQGHYPYLKTENIRGIFPNFNKKESDKGSCLKVFDLFEEAKNLIQ